MPDATNVMNFLVSISKIFPCRSERKLFYEPYPIGNRRGLKNLSRMKKHGMFVQIAAIKFSGVPKGAISARFHLISIRNDFSSK
jgi:hypothetical protein